VTATVGTGTATTATVKVTVGSLPDITITPSGTPTEGQPVTFTIAVTGTSTESFQSIVVDFGDGTNSGVLSGGNQTVAHTYGRAGTYLVEATGTASSGSSKRATTTVAVADRGIVDVRITKSPDVVTEDDPVTFTATVTGGGTVRSYSWNFGDGQTFNGGSQISHVYRSTGPRTVTVTVSTTDGNSGKGQIQFVVQP
jgi:PKD repeat protein